MRPSTFKQMCAAGLFGIFSSTLSKSPVLPIFAVHLGATPSEVGIIAAISTLAGIALSIPAGVLSDRLGRKTMLVLAGIVFASAPAMYLFATGNWQLAAIRFYHGFSTAIFMPVAMAFISDLHEGAKGEKLGWFSSSTLVGRFMAPLTGGALLGYYGSESTFGFVSIYSICLVSGIFVLVLSARMPSPPNVAPATKSWREQISGLSQLFSSRPLLCLGMMEASVLFMYGTIEVFLPLYGLRLGLGAFEIGICLSAQVITLAATKPIMGRMSDKRGRSGQIVWGAVLGATAVAVLAVTGSFIAILLISVLIGLSLSIVTSATSAAVADVSRCEMRGSAMGVFGTIMDLGHSSGPLVSGLLAAQLGYGAAFVGAAIVVAAALIVFKATVASQLELCSQG
jgi:MFS transporter, DHA1 family, multidrug resistance protein